MVGGGAFKYVPQTTATTFAVFLLLLLVCVFVNRRHIVLSYTLVTRVAAPGGGGPLRHVLPRPEVAVREPLHQHHLLLLLLLYDNIAFMLY